MILKQSPDDFQVKELTDIRAGTEGPFSLYRLEKSGWTTPDALAAVRRRWQVEFDRVSYGGLKDRHAQTIQHVSILRGPRRRFTQEGIQLEYLGQVHEPFTSSHIRANRFSIVLRGGTAAEIEQAVSALGDVSACGVPNYFDDQRFGSVTGDREFIAKRMVLGDFEGALKLALVGPYEFDRAEEKREKKLLAEHWGDWATLRSRLPRSHARSLIVYLADHPDDFRGASARLRPELRGLYLSAFQSHLWNRLLDVWLRANLPAESLVSIPLRLGPCAMHGRLNPEQMQLLAQTELPLPSARTRLGDEDPRKPLLDAVLAEEGLTLDQMQVRGIREIYFSKGDRPVLCVPERMTWSSASDESRPGKEKLLLEFELPRGAYATLIVKRITRERRTK